MLLLTRIALWMKLRFDYATCYVINKSLHEKIKDKKCPGNLGSWRMSGLLLISDISCEKCPYYNPEKKAR